MATVTAALVKELRERTGAGMMECKRKQLKKLVTLLLKAQSSFKKQTA